MAVWWVRGLSSANSVSSCHCGTKTSVFNSFFHSIFVHYLYVASLLLVMRTVDGTLALFQIVAILFANLKLLF